MWRQRKCYLNVKHDIIIHFFSHLVDIVIGCIVHNGISEHKHHVSLELNSRTQWTSFNVLLYCAQIHGSKNNKKSVGLQGNKTLDQAAKLFQLKVSLKCKEVKLSFPVISFIDINLNIFLNAKRNKGQRTWHLIETALRLTWF